MYPGRLKTKKYVQYPPEIEQLNLMDLRYDDHYFFVSIKAREKQYDH